MNRKDLENLIGEDMEDMGMVEQCESHGVHDTDRENTEHTDLMCRTCRCFTIEKVYLSIPFGKVRYRCTTCQSETKILSRHVHPGALKFYSVKDAHP